MRGSPYSTKAWQQLRAAVLIRDGGLCQIRGSRCAGIADTAHHILPSSTHPERFWDPANLQAACKPCNYGDGAVVRVSNREHRQTIAGLQALVEEQQAEIDELRRQLEQRDEPEPEREPRVPCIH